MWCVIHCFVLCKQKTAYEMRIIDWSSDVCSSDLRGRQPEIPSAPCRCLCGTPHRPAATGPKVKLALFTSDPEADPFTKATVRQAKIGRASRRARVCQDV